MTDRKPKVVVTRKLPEPVEARMRELFDVVLNRDDRPMDAAALTAAVADADVLVPTITDHIDKALIAVAGPRLRIIANFGAGVDHIDVEAAHARGIAVTNTPGVLTEDTADMTMALIMAVTRRLVEGANIAQAGEFAGWSPTWMLGKRLRGASLGIVGMGRIGRAVATRARAFGLSIHYHNRHRLPAAVEAEFAATWHETLDSMLAVADIVTIHTPRNAESENVIDARRIGLMKPDAFLINAARGGIVDEDALIEALEAGRLGGAGLDVWKFEPQIDPRLLALPNVVMLPHMGSATYEGRLAMGEKVIANIRMWADGHRPPDQVLEGWV